MAKTVFDKETYSLDDGTEIVLSPLPIGRLKKFMKQWEKFNTGGAPLSNDDAFDVYLIVSGISLSKQFQDKFENNVNEAGELSADYRAYLEDVLDLETATKIIEICGGINLSDPKLEEMLEAAQAQAAAAGQN